MNVPHLTPRRFGLWIGGLALLLLTVCAGAPFIGPVSLDLAGLFAGTAPADREIFFAVRLPRVLLAALVGGGLGLCGAVLQAFLRNPLATPFTLGITGGSSFGAVLAIGLGLDFSLLGFTPVPVFAFTGALVSVGLVFALSRAGGKAGAVTLLLAGVTINFFFSSLILLMQYLAGTTHQSFQMVRWLMGGLDVVGFRVLLQGLPFVVLGAVPLLYYARGYNLMTLGEEAAGGLGLDVERIKTVTFFATSLLVGVVTAMAGPISFIGLITPHVLRLLIGSDHRLLLPGAFLAGGAFLVVCDTLARTVLGPVELPVGIITALAGAPFFVWLLHRRAELSLS